MKLKICRIVFIFSLAILSASTEAWTQWVELIPSYSGNLTVSEEYNFGVIYHWPDGTIYGQPPDAVQYFEWSPPGDATVVGTPTANRLTLKFNSTGTHYISLQVYVGSNSTYYWGEVGVNVTGPPAPNTTFSTSQNCGITTVTRNTSPVGNVAWYWQTSAYNTDLTLGSGVSTYLSTSGPLYLRTRQTVSPYAWSENAVYVGSINVNALPASPTGNNNIRCGSGAITLGGTPASGANSLKWYNANGTPAQPNPSTSFSPSPGFTTTYYISSYNTSTGCESSSSSRTPVTATIIQTAGQAPGTIQVDPIVATGDVIINLTGSVSTVNRFTIKKPDGSLAEENWYYDPPFTFNFPTPGTWDIFSRPEMSGLSMCMGEVSAFKSVMVVPAIPDLPAGTFSIVQNCGSTQINRNALYPPPANVWYWQSEAMGESESLGSGSSIVRTESGPLYLRARLTIAPYTWSTSSQYVGNISVNAIPSSPQVNNGGAINCGYGQVSLSGTPAPGANSLKWYNANGTLAQPTATTSFAHPLSVTTTYYISSVNTITGCESSSSSRTPITATIIQTSNISPGTIVVDPIVASGDITINLTGSPSAVNRFTIKKPDGSLAEENWYYDVPFSFNMPIPGTWEIYSRPELGGINMCLGDTPASKITIVVPNPPNVPATAFSSVQSMCNTAITRSIEYVPIGTHWYWQTQADGTSTDLGNGVSIQKKTTGPLFLRARLSVAPYTWSTSSLFVGNIMVIKPPTPVVQPVGAICSQSKATINITRSIVSTNTAYWYETDASPDRFLESFSFETPGLTTSRKYWVSTHNPAGCESDKIEVAITVLPISLDGTCTVNENYIMTNAIQVSDIKQLEAVEDLSIGYRSQNIQYFDGLGRPMQQVGRQASPQGKDIIQPIVYDEFGREAMKYVPFVAQETSGWYQDNALLIDQGTKDYIGLAANFYNDPQKHIADDDNKPFAVTLFEPSSLNRILKQGAPGAPWQPNADPGKDKTIKKQYRSSLGADAILKFGYDNNTNQLIHNGVYGDHKLNVNVTWDENNMDAIEFHDKEGKLVCKKIYAKTENDVKHYAETYYIYDDFGNLVVVLPPEGVEKLKTDLNLN